jgi:hypothetical protein
MRALSNEDRRHKLDELAKDCGQALRLSGRSGA